MTIDQKNPDPRDYLAQLCSAAQPDQGVGLALDQWGAFWFEFFRVLRTSFEVTSPRDFVRLTELEKMAALTITGETVEPPDFNLAAQGLYVLAQRAFMPATRWPRPPADPVPPCPNHVPFGRP